MEKPLNEAVESATSSMSPTGLDTMTVAGAFLVAMGVAVMASGFGKVDFHWLYSQIVSPHGLLTSVLGILCLGLGFQYTSLRNMLGTIYYDLLKTHPYLYSSAVVTGLIGYGSTFIVSKYVRPEMLLQQPAEAVAIAQGLPQQIADAGVQQPLAT